MCSSVAIDLKELIGSLTRSPLHVAERVVHGWSKGADIVVLAKNGCVSLMCVCVHGGGNSLSIHVRSPIEPVEESQLEPFFVIKDESYPLQARKLPSKHPRLQDSKQTDLYNRQQPFY